MSMPIGGKFKAGVSLHGHTSHSHESLRFLYNLSKQSAALRFLLQRGERQYLAKYGAPLDLSRGWWTPPLGPQQAWDLETRQLESLDLTALVSLTDHDKIAAPLALRAIDGGHDVPISVEWTLPHRGAELHVGIHNLPFGIAVEFAAAMDEYTKQPKRLGPGALLEYASTCPGTLVVLNHPLWDEVHAGEARHMESVRLLLATCGKFIHALEWNGLRTHGENLRVIGLARAWSKPVVSGGDRHTFEANSVINLTNAVCMSEFVEEVRCGHSTMMLTKTYRQPRRLRMMRMLADVLSAQPEHPQGWTKWSDRVFFAGASGENESLTSLWDAGMPKPLRLLDAATNFLHLMPFQGVLEMTTAGRGPVFIS